MSRDGRLIPECLGMVDCYLGLGRQREAATIATGACKQMANSPQALTLYAIVLLKVSVSDPDLQRLEIPTLFHPDPKVAFKKAFKYFLVHNSQTLSYCN